LSAEVGNTKCFYLVGMEHILSKNYHGHISIRTSGIAPPTYLTALRCDCNFVVRFLWGIQRATYSG